MEWVFEDSGDYRQYYRIKKILYNERSDFQDILIAETYKFGKILLLDNAIMLTERFEFFYHEAISHPALFTHKNPKNVLIIGGGDGGTLREVLKHKEVENVDLVEIDKKVIESCKKYIKTVSKSFDDPKANVIIMDGIKYVNETDRRYDIILVDSADPKGPAVVLFKKEFFKNCYKILNDDGIIVTQAESPVFYSDYFKKIYKMFLSIFKITMPYIANVPDYPQGIWAFMLGSKKYHPFKDFNKEKISKIKTKYYNEKVHSAIFSLPNYVKEILK